jgi:putative membrane protein
MRDRVVLPLIGVVSVAVVAVVALLLLGSPRSAGAGSVLPSVNALLNGGSGVLLVGGFVSIRRRRVAAHRACMLAAFALSVLFLISYVTYHASSGSRAFVGHGWIRWIYFPLLVSHIVLAAGIVPLALVTLYRAWRAEFERHRRVARWTFPFWLYVSVTGVVVYWMLYHLTPPG